MKQFFPAMFSPIRICALLLAAILITTGLYYLDTDSPSDNLYQCAAVGAIVLLVITLLYAAGYGLVHELQRRRA